MKNSVKVNGTTYEFEKNQVLVVLGNQLMVDQTVVQTDITQPLQVEVVGDPVAVYSSARVTVLGNVNGDVDTQGSVDVTGDVQGKVVTQGRVVVGGGVGGKVDTQGSVEVKGNVDGNIHTMGSVTVGGSQKGKIDTVGRVSIGSKG